MSKENVALFSQAIGRNAELNRQVSEAGNDVEQWVTIAEEMGFEFTPDEFADVVGETLGRTVTPSNAVEAFLGAQFRIGDLELQEKTMDAVLGGARRAITNL